MRTFLLVAVALVVAAVGVGCGSDADSSDAPASAVATTTQVADFVHEVGGDRVAAEQILEANADPHGYEPRPSDAAAIAEADVIFSSGGEVDEWLGDLIDGAGGDAIRVDLFDSVEPRIDGVSHEDHSEERAGHDEETDHGDENHDHGNEDPHWWQDPHNAILAVEAIEDALAAADPPGARQYRGRARAYIARLRRLDRNVANCIGQIPRRQRRLVTTHDALGYYADRYGLTVVGALIPSLSSAAQPSAGEIEQLVDEIRAQDVNAIFPESSLSAKLEQAVSREAGASVGRPLWADALGPEGSSGDTYIRSIQSNTEAIVEGLTGGAVRCRPAA